MRVIVPPVVVGDRICRIVAAVESLLEVEEWAGQWWEPSTITLSDASHGTTADAELLHARGVPLADWIASSPRSGESEIQAWLQARDPERGQEMRLNDDVMRSTPVRRRSYPGNARFSSRTIAAVERKMENLERRHPSDGTSQGPRRRKTDAPAAGDGAVQSGADESPRDVPSGAQKGAR